LALVHDQPLACLGSAMFSKLGLMDAYNLDPDKVSNFFAEVGRGYHRDVPYHNEAHAASVLHFTFALMTHGGVAAAMNQQIDFHMSCLAALVAAAIHDYDHLGVNNQYLEVTNHDRAACGAQHVNEQHHLVCGLAVLNMPGCNFFEHFGPSERFQFEELVSALVLGTDAADDRYWREQFQEVLNADQKLSFEPSSYEQAVLGLKIMLKCADLGHLATPWAEHCKWVDRLEQEFFAQGDQEKDSGFEEISFLMDREFGGVSENQSGFFEFVALPLFRTLVKAFPSAQPMLCAVEANSDRWAKIEKHRKRLMKRHTA